MLNISKRMRSLASLCSTKSEHNAKQVERLFQLIVLKQPVDYQQDIKPTVPETYENAAEWGIPAGHTIYKNEGFVTLTMVNARRVMLYKPSIRKIGEWVSVYVANGHPDHGYLGNPEDPDKLTLVNCRSGEMIRAARERSPADVSLSNSGNFIVTHSKDTVSMSAAIQEALKSNQKYTSHVNGWWMNENMLKYFLLGNHDSLYLGENQRLQATYDYICK